MELTQGLGSRAHMSYSLNSLSYIGDYIGNNCRAYSGGYQECRL